MLRRLISIKAWRAGIGFLAVVGLIAFTSMILYAGDPQPPRFWGKAYSSNGNFMPMGTAIYATSIANPDEVYIGYVVDNQGNYQLYTCDGCEGRQFVINYGSDPYYYGILASPPAQVDIRPENFQDYSELIGH